MEFNAVDDIVDDFLRQLRHDVHRRSLVVVCLVYSVETSPTLTLSRSRLGFFALSIIETENDLDPFSSCNEPKVQLANLSLACCFIASGS